MLTRRIKCQSWTSWQTSICCKIVCLLYTYYAHLLWNSCLMMLTVFIVCLSVVCFIVVSCLFCYVLKWYYPSCHFLSYSPSSNTLMSSSISSLRRWFYIQIKGPMWSMVDSTSNHHKGRACCLKFRGQQRLVNVTISLETN